LRERIVGHPRFNDFAKYGYMGFWEVWQLTLNQGSWPLHKFGSLFDPSKYDRFNTPYKACSSCPIGCKFQSKIPDGKFKGNESCTINPSTLPRVGNRLRLENIDEILAICRALDKHGVDVTTFITMASFVVKMFKSGKLSAKEVGFKPDYDVKTMLRLVKLVTERDGIGDILADGFIRVGDAFDIDIEMDPETPIAKGVDPIYDARFTGLDPLRFTYFTSPRPHHGGAHSILTKPSSVPHSPTTIDMIKKNFSQMGLSDEEFTRIFEPMENYAGFNLVLATKAMEDNCAIYDSLGVCSMPPVLGMADIITFSKIYNLATGAEEPVRELRKKAERVINLHKAINVREGFGRNDDRVKAWLLPKDTPEGQLRMTDYYRTKFLDNNDLRRFLDEYYKNRGWSVETGLPTREKLTTLGLEDIANDLGGTID
jgi:aldehyde:ferredoxin oxidoreductase